MLKYIFLIANAWLYKLNMGFPQANNLLGNNTTKFVDYMILLTIRNDCFGHNS